MFLIGAVIIGVVLGYLLRGRIINLSSLRLRAWWLVVVAMAIQFSIFPLFSERALIQYLTTELHLLSYGLLFLFFVINYRICALLILAVGAISNLVVISVNSGRMPSSARALACAGQADIADKLVRNGVVGNIVLMGRNTRLDFLGDWLYLPHGVPLATAFSVGDLLIAIGLVLLIVHGMRQHA